MPQALPGVDDSLQAVIFDFDGVLVESAGIKSEAFRALFAHRPEHIEQIAALHEHHVGVDRYTKFKMIYRDILHEPLNADETRRLASRFECLVEERVALCSAVPGAQDLLETLRGRVPMAVASSTPQEELERIVDRRGLAGYFCAVRGSPPPKRELVKAIVSHHAWDPRGVLMVGDAVADYEAARAACTRFIGRGQGTALHPFPPEVTTIIDLVPLAQAARELVRTLPRPAAIAR